MNRKYYELKVIPDLSLSKYSSLDSGDVGGVIQAHSHFWRQMHRKGLLSGESFHLFYEYNPERPIGSRLKIGICVDAQTEGETYIEQTVQASPLSPFFELQKMDDSLLGSEQELNPLRKYRYDAHLIKKERFSSE